MSDQKRLNADELANIKTNEHKQPPELWLHIAALEEEIDKLTCQTKLLNRWIDDLQSGMHINCVYCGHQYGPNSETPARKALEKHVEKCSFHPMSKLKEDNIQLRQALEGLRNSYDCFCDAHAPRGYMCITSHDYACDNAQNVLDNTKEYKLNDES